MTVEQFAVIHPVQLIAGKNQLVIILAPHEPVQVLPDGIGGALKPIGIGHRLLGGQNFDEAFCKWIEPVRVDDVAIQRSRIELREDENLLQSGVQAVADGNIDQSIFSSERYRRLRSVLPGRPSCDGPRPGPAVGSGRRPGEIGVQEAQAVRRGGLAPERARELDQILDAPAPPDVAEHPHVLQVEQHAAGRGRRSADQHVHVLQVVVVDARPEQSSEELAERVR